MAFPCDFLIVVDTTLMQLILSIHEMGFLLTPHQCHVHLKMGKENAAANRFQITW